MNAGGTLIADLLASAQAHLSAGRLAEAQASGLAILKAEPDQPDALHLLGAVALKAGRPAEAVDLIARAARGQPASVPLLANLAAALRAAGRGEEALDALRQAFKLDPGFIDGLLLLAEVFGDLGRSADAAKALRELVTARPHLMEPRLQLSRHLIMGGRLEEAVEELLEVLAMAPASGAAYANMGVALNRLQRGHEAVAAYHSALAFLPDDPAILNNLGIALQDLGRTAEADSCFRRCLMLDPSAAPPLLSLALAGRDSMRLADGLRWARRASVADPALPDAHAALGHLLLLTGAYREGFAEYEWRTKMASFPSPRRSFDSPAWDGRNPADLTILLHDEQGIGDSIMFARFAALLQARGARVYVECNKLIVGVLATMPGLAGVIERYGPLPAHDCHASLASLPHLLGTGLYTVPAMTGYLKAEPEATARWGRRLGSRRGLRIGLVWAGNPEFKADRIRSPRLRSLMPLLDIPGLEFFGLQKGPGRAELDEVGPRPASFTDLGDEIADFADTAAIMANLDLVISSCTGPAHLAGALARPTWTLLPFAPDWRWLDSGVCTPWYPTMRLFRQDSLGDWTPMVRRVGEALHDLRRIVG